MRRLWPLLLAGCVADSRADHLEGSLVEVLRLGFSETRARLYPGELSIEYVDSTGIVALRVTSHHPEVPATGTYDLVTFGHVAPADVLLLAAPNVAVGDLFLSNHGDRVSGSFSVTFEPIDSRILTAFGDFSAPLEVMDVP